MALPRESDGTRKRNIFEPKSREPYKISRSKIELFLRCARCFYLDRRLGIGQPSGPPFNLNLAVDALLKREFDAYRAALRTHELMTKFGIDAIPFQHPKLQQWRENFTGVQVLHAPTNLLVYGAVDDLWQDPEGNILVVDYKATSTVREISLDDEWKKAYKRQMEMYQWLMRGQDLPVSDVGYFVFANADSAKENFAGKLEFAMTILSYVGDDSWVEDALREVHRCLMMESPPSAAMDCEWCAYRRAAQKAEYSAGHSA